MKGVIQVKRCKFLLTCLKIGYTVFTLKIFYSLKKVKIYKHTKVPIHYV